MSDFNMSTWQAPPITEVNPVSKTQSRDRTLINRALNHKHMVETIERFEWKNLPPEIPNDLIERVLYFRFKGALFYNSTIERFIFLPFTLKGKDSDTIDSYGRYHNILPVLFTGQWKTGGDGETSEDIAYMSDRTYTVVYDLPQEEEAEEEEGQDMEGETPDDVSVLDDTKAVILTDSTLEVSQDYISMQQLALPFNEQLTDILVLVNMDLISSAKAFYIVAKDADQKDAIEAELANMDNRILNGKRYVVVTSPTKLEELTGSSVKDTARYFQSYQSIDNLRKDLIGQDNGGTFMKQEHTTEMETETNSNSGSAVLNNALRMRQDFCKIANSVFGLNIEVEVKGGSEDPIVEPQGAQTQDREGNEE